MLTPLAHLREHALTSGDKAVMVFKEALKRSVLLI